MYFKFFTVALLGLYAQVTFSQEIDAVNSGVTFEVSNMGANTVNGTLTGMQGEINFAPDDLSNASFQVCVDPGTVNTSNDKRDQHLLAEDFFNVAAYLNICFTSASIVQTADGYLATGDLTIRDVTKTVEIPFQFEDQTFTGELVIDRRDYGVGPKRGFMVGKEVTIQINCKIK